MRPGLKRYTVPLTNEQTGEQREVEVEGYNDYDAQVVALVQEFRESEYRWRYVRAGQPVELEEERSA